MEKIRIIIVDDHQLFRNGLKILLDSFPEFEVAGEASNGEEFLKLIKTVKADVALMDINMPQLDGIDATRRGLKLCPELNIIALSMYGEEEYYYKMVDAGAKGFLLKDSDIAEVKEAINTVIKGGSKLIKTVKADVALMDINMPQLDGIDATRRGLKLCPELNIIALSMYGEEEYYYKMVDAGAKGFLLKDSDIAEVKEAINTVIKGGSFFSQELLYYVIQKIKHREHESKTANLSKREKEILLKICDGLSNQEIAETLFISKRTVDKHRANLLGKTNSKNTASLILFAIRNKLIEI